MEGRFYSRTYFEQLVNLLLMSNEAFSCGFKLVLLSQKRVLDGGRYDLV